MELKVTAGGSVLFDIEGTPGQQGALVEKNVYFYLTVGDARFYSAFKDASGTLTPLGLTITVHCIAVALAQLVRTMPEQTNKEALFKDLSKEFDQILAGISGKPKMSEEYTPVAPMRGSTEN